jgi:hypothetical protein
MKRRTAGWVERDVHGRWRRLYCWTQKAGAVKKVKRIGNRRERREGRAQARRGGDE